VIRIRYSNELGPGLHGRVERRGRDTFIYLLPGLTPQQRQAALRRMRQQGKMGVSPRLPVIQVVAALVADRVRTVFGQAGAIMRVHPAGSTLPVMAVSVAIGSFLVLSALSVHIVHLPPQAGGAVSGSRVPGGGAVEPFPSPSDGQSADPSGGAGQQGDRPGGQTGGTNGGASGSQSNGRSPAGGATGPGDMPSPGSSPAPGSTPSSGSSPGPGGPSPSGSPSPGGSGLTSASATTPPSQDPTPVANPTVTPSPTPSSSPSPAPTSHTGQVCVDIGALGICLGL
jgi:hypothetical protein